METTEKLAASLAEASSLETEDTRRGQWFSKMFHSLETDKLLLETDTASEQKKKLYEIMMSADFVATSAFAKEAFNQTLTKKALVSFIIHIAKSGAKPRRLAFNIANSSLLVWAVVADDDFSAEKAIYLAQSAVNTELLDADYRVSATVVDESDNMEIPAHYEEARITESAAI